MWRQPIDYTNPTAELTEELAQTHALNATEQKKYCKEM